MKAARPNTIRWFEYTLFASQLIRIVIVVLHLDAMARITGLSPQTILISPFTNAAVLIGLGLVVSRAKIGFARWFLLVLMALDVIGLAGIPTVAAMIGVPFAAFSTLAVLLVAVAGILMFLPTSNEWLKRDKVMADEPSFKASDYTKPEAKASWINTIVIQWSKRRSSDD